MPQSSQNLYFHLGMNADDDGFCEHFALMRMTDSKPDDLKILQAKGFVTVFDDRVLVISDWKENNYLRNDRYSPSKYLEIYKEELKGLVSGIPNCNQRDTQVRLGKDRIGESTEEPTVTPISKKVIKNTFGEFEKVKLSNDEYSKLLTSIGEKNTNLLIVELDTYIASKGKRYSNHYATILNWARRKVLEHKDSKSNVAFA